MRLRERLLAREQLRGIVLKMPCPAEVELAGTTGFDFVVVDTEHGPWNGVELEHHLRAADAAGVPALVRVPGLDAAAIGAALDAGATGVVVPHVSTQRQARDVVAAARYPPEGNRGMARSTRAGRYGTSSAADHVERATGTCVVVQIEDLDGADAAAEIAAVPGVDALFPGAVDIAAGIGVAEPRSDPRVAEAVERVLAAAAAGGVAAMAVAGDRSEAQRLASAGATAIVCVGSTLVAAAFRHAASWTTDDATPAPADCPLVLLPGMLCGPEMWEPFLAASDVRWSPQFARIDLDGSIPDMARSVLAVAPERFTAVGHSLGGIVLLEILRQAPDRVAAAVLVATSARPPTAEQLSAWEGLAGQVEGGEFDEIARVQPDLLIGRARAGDSALRDTVETMARRTGAAGFMRQLEAQRARVDLRPALDEVNVPVLVVSGEDDTVCPPELQEEIAAGIGGAVHQRIPGVGHLAPLEDAEAFARVLASWASGNR